MFDEIRLTLQKSQAHDNFGFRIAGGSEDGTQARVGQILTSGAAEESEMMEIGDIVAEIDGENVLGADHKRVIRLMQEASKRGQVQLVLRRRLRDIPRSISMPSRLPNSTAPAAPGMTPTMAPGMAPTMAPGMGADFKQYPYEVTVVRQENEGFGFVIISSVNKNGSAIGKKKKNQFFFFI